MTTYICGTDGKLQKYSLLKTTPRAGCTPEDVTVDKCSESDPEVKGQSPYCSLQAQPRLPALIPQTRACAV